MDQDLSNRLDRIEKLVKDNNDMLSKMRKAQKNAAYIRLVYWAILIILTIASFYFIQPYISQLGAAYGIGGGSTTDTTATGDSNSPSTSAAVMSLIKQYEASQKAGK